MGTTLHSFGKVACHRPNPPSVPQMHKTLVTTYDRRRSGQSSAVTTWFTSPSGRKQSQCHLSAATGTIRSLAPSLRLHRPRRLLQREQLSPAFNSEWQRTDCEDKGAELSFQGAELQRQPLKMDQEGRTDGGATSPPNVMVPTELTTPDCFGACYGDKVDTFVRDSRRGGTSPQTNSGPHKQQTHRQPNKHRCRFCPYSCLSGAAVAIHERTHTGERPFSCGVCEKTFAQKPHLTSHVRIHTGEKPFKCSTCSRAFTQKSALTSHVRTHTGEKPYRCNTCSRTFTNKGSLVNHERTRTGEKPFKCKTCGRAFAAYSNLLNHRKIHCK
ncbi:zinc finger protein 239-like isoform X2 [Ixodes scapularis]|uniref:zinc finger protein 239-like isoform X2 n=1 Tax=Ixodes scapularis TaxID=6945 RepID=UPI001C390F24|nr:zinc finger protein 239-like isoform X2 [Ixodes scapularis]XP_042149121.1 zinc finger protein 239-like isoform X2 [Ixodes scapularis]